VGRGGDHIAKRLQEFLITRLSRGLPSTELTDARIKHLEFLQAIIARQATNSFLLKGWALTVAAAFFGFVASQLHWRLALVALLPIVAFWFLDTYFLRQERLFRCLYEASRHPGSIVPLFSMDTRPHRNESATSWRKVAFSFTLSIFYGMLMGVGLALLIAGIIHDATPAHAARTRTATSSATSSAHGSRGGQMSPMWSPSQRGTKWICRWKIV